MADPVNNSTTVFALRQKLLVRFVEILYAVTLSLSQGCGGDSSSLDAMTR